MPLVAMTAKVEHLASWLKKAHDYLMSGQLIDKPLPNIAIKHTEVNIEYFSFNTQCAMHLLWSTHVLGFPS